MCLILFKELIMIYFSGTLARFPELGCMENNAALRGFYNLSAGMGVVYTSIRAQVQ